MLNEKSDLKYRTRRASISLASKCNFPNQIYPIQDRSHVKSCFTSVTFVVGLRHVEMRTNSSIGWLMFLFVSETFWILAASTGDKYISINS